LKALQTRPAAQSETMDVMRGRSRRLPRWTLPVAALVMLAVVTAWAMRSLMAPQTTVTIDRSSILTDTAKRGALVLSVRADGSLAPERVQVISAGQAGVVSQVFVKAGNVVSPGAVVAQMQNPSLTAAAADARAALRVASANLASAREDARASVIAQQTQEADAAAGHSQDALQATSLRKLHAKGLISDIQYRTAEIQSQKSMNDLRSTRAQVHVAIANSDAKIAEAQAKVDQAAAQLSADQAQIGALTVRAATSGVVQSVDVDPGTSVVAGTQIARVADLHDLKAVLQVTEGDVKPVTVGMPALVDDGNGVAAARVARIAPAAQNGTVAVDVTFTKDPPPGARPAMNVQGTVVVSTIPHAVSIQRPAGVADGASIDLFKVVDGGTRAVRERVTLGRGTSDRVQIVSGLSPGDTVIVSDMTSYLNHGEVRLR
jgi:HlyD family secretion protein